MRSHTLHAAMRAFAEDAAGLLAGDTASGAEVPFELVEEGAGRRTPLYCYRPLVGEFVRDRATALERLPSHSGAVAALGDHADRLPRYLAALGDRPGGGPTTALQALLGAVFGEQTDFALDDERFARAYKQLEEALFAGRTDATVVVPVLGLDIVASRRLVRFTRPRLPSFLEEVSIKNLRVGDATVDLHLERHTDDAGINVVRRTGEVELVGGEGGQRVAVVEDAHGRHAGAGLPHQLGVRDEVVHEVRAGGGAGWRIGPHAGSSPAGAVRTKHR